MNFAPRGQTEQINTDWWSGFLAAVFTGGALLLLYHLVEWVGEQPQPEGTLEFLTTARFSISDIASAVLLVVVIAMVVSMVVMRR